MALLPLHQVSPRLTRFAAPATAPRFPGCAPTSANSGDEVCRQVSKERMVEGIFDFLEIKKKASLSVSLIFLPHPIPTERKGKTFQSLNCCL